MIFKTQALFTSSAHENFKSIFIFSMAARFLVFWKKEKETPGFDFFPPGVSLIAGKRYPSAWKAGIWVREKESVYVNEN